MRSAVGSSASGNCLAASRAKRSAKICCRLWSRSISLASSATGSSASGYFSWASRAIFAAMMRCRLSSRSTVLTSSCNGSSEPGFCCSATRASSANWLSMAACSFAVMMRWRAPSRSISLASSATGSSAFGNLSCASFAKFIHAAASDVSRPPKSLPVCSLESKPSAACCACASARRWALAASVACLRFTAASSADCRAAPDKPSSFALSDALM